MMRLLGTQLLTATIVLVTAVLFSGSSFAMEDIPDEVELGVLENLYEPVIFDHAMHVDVAEDCSVCHHHTTGTEPVNSYCLKCHAEPKEMDVVACQDCHAADAQAAENLHKAPTEFVFHDDQPNLKAAYHLNCLGCHREVGGPVGCEDCHAKTEAGEKFYHSGKFAPVAQGHEAKSH